MVFQKNNRIFVLYTIRIMTASYGSGYFEIVYFFIFSAQYTPRCLFL